MYLNGANATISNEESGYLRFQTAGAERAVIDSSGNLGIGTSSPASSLHVEKASTDNIIAAIGQTGYEGVLYLSGAGSGKDTSIVYGNDRNLIFRTTATATPTASGTAVMTLTATGNLGIGTSSPDNKLEVTVGDNGGINIEQTGAGQTGYLNFRDSDGVLEGRISYDHSNNSLRFVTSQTEKFRITSAGDVGIGTSSPAYKLDVAGAINSSADVISQGNDARISLYRSAELITLTGHPVSRFTSALKRQQVAVGEVQKWCLRTAATSASARRVRQAGWRF